MTTKKSSGGFLSLIFIIVIIFLGYLFLKGGGGGSSADLDEYYGWLAQEGDTSYALIDQAYAAGTIDYETSLLYKTYAAFGADELPGEYASDVFASDQANWIFAEVKQNYDSFSEGTRVALEPFMLRPEEEGSYFNLQYQAGAYDQEEQALIPKAQATRPNATLYTDFLESADGEVKIWYPNDTIVAQNPGGLGALVLSTGEAEKLAKQMKALLDTDKIIGTYIEFMGKNLMPDNGGGDDRLDIYVAPTGTDLGWTWGESSPPTSSYVLINPVIFYNQKVFETTVAHELFHVFQYVFKYNTSKDDWWAEATATWAEDFIYPTDNTEQGYLKAFIEHPDVELDKTGTPENHEYGAYILAYFMSQNFGDQTIADTWWDCGSSTCLDAVDGILDGGFQKQWKEFTLWNYNKSPVDYYFDYPSFSTLTSESGSNTEDIWILAEETLIDVDTLKRLTSEINTAQNQLPADTNIKKLTFTDLSNFNNKSDKSGLKAIIYYKNGTKDVEDWSDLTKRSFCVDNPNEDFEKVVLIMSNGDKENSIASSQIKVEGKESCYEIDQHDTAQTVVYFAGAAIGASLEIKSLGEPTEKSAEEDYEYQTKWEVYYEFEQIREAFSVPCDGSTADFGPGWTTRDAGYMKFDLSSEAISEDSTFSVDLHFGLSHPKGSFEVVPELAVNCANLFFASSYVSDEGYTGVVEGIYQGEILEMDENGAKILIKDSCYYDNCYMATGELFQSIDEAIVLEIKKKGN